MRETESVTDRGTGVWGQQRYDVELLTDLRVWQDAAEATERSITEWHLLCSEVGRRRFTSQQERDSFLAQSFFDLNLTRVDPPEVRIRRLPYERVIGQWLSQVCFVEDYLQLRFDYSGLTLNVLPTLIPAHGPMIRRGQRGYADGLVDLINSTVLAVDEVLDIGLVVDFDDGTRIEVPLASQPFPEVAEYSSTDDHDGWFWIAGEPPWEKQPDQPAGRR